MRKVLSILISLMCLSTYAQSQLDIGILPKIVASTELTDHLSLAGSLQSRLLRKGDTDMKQGFMYALTDLTGIAEYRLRGGTRLAAGYLLRSRKGEIIHRSLQQASWTRSLHIYRLGHRLRTDQTYLPSGDIALRLRYALSLQVPLQGLNLDPRELYLKLGVEQLHQLAEGEFSTELRFIPALGYYHSDKSKIELGVDSRYDSLWSEDDTLTLWSTISYYWRF